MDFLVSEPMRPFCNRFPVSRKFVRVRSTALLRPYKGVHLLPVSLLLFSLGMQPLVLSLRIKTVLSLSHIKCSGQYVAPGTLP